MMKHLIAAVLLTLTSAAPAATVSTQAEFNTAMKAGDTEVSLVAGQPYTVPYGSKNTTIKSADPTKPATIKSVGGALSNVTITDVVFDAGNAPLAVINSQKVTVTDSVARSTNTRVKNGNTMTVRVTGSSEVALSRLKISGGDVSVFISMSSKVSLTDSDVDNIGRDGMNVFATSDLTIARNHFQDWHFIGDEHPDGIQFWTTNSPSGVVRFLIEDNLIECSPTMRAQGIFINDEANLAAKGTGHVDGIIRRNRNTSTMWHSIGAVNVRGLAINDNEVLFEINPADVSKPDSQVSKRSWIKVVGAGSVTNNIAGEFVGGTPSGNIVKLSATRAEIDTVIAGWLSEFRAPALTIEQRVDRLEKLVGLK